MVKHCRTVQTLTIDEIFFICLNIFAIRSPPTVCTSTAQQQGRFLRSEIESRHKTSYQSVLLPSTATFIPRSWILIVKARRGDYLMFGSISRSETIRESVTCIVKFRRCLTLF